MAVVHYDAKDLGVKFSILMEKVLIILWIVISFFQIWYWGIIIKEQDMVWLKYSMDVQYHGMDLYYNIVLWSEHFMGHLIVTHNWETVTLSTLSTMVQICLQFLKYKMNSTRNRWVMMMVKRIGQNLLCK